MAELTFDNHEIYSNSTLNISAAEGHIREGLVFDRKTLYTNPHRVTVGIPKSQNVIHLQAFPDKWFLRPLEGLLNKRGWVFQERTLAPRIIHFTKDQIFWECHTLEASEVLPHGVPDQGSAHLGKGAVISPTLSVQQLKSRWYQIVEEYSHTSLTFVDDRLLAISAVAKRFCSALRLDPPLYLAGMWKDDLPLSMLWSQNLRPSITGAESVTHAETEMKHAPSWSWASILGPISNVDSSSLIATTEVLGVEIARISPNFFGGADSCRVRLRGSVCKFSRRVHDGVSWVYIAQHAEFQEFNDFDFQNCRSIIIEWDTFRRIVAEELHTSSRRSASSAYFFLHIASEQGIDGSMERGIVLRKTAVRGTYTRVGSFFTPAKSEYTGSKLEDAFNGCTDTLDTDEYLQLDRGGKYTIDVV